MNFLSLKKTGVVIKNKIKLDAVSIPFYTHVTKDYSKWIE